MRRRRPGRAAAYPAQQTQGGEIEMVVMEVRDQHRIRVGEEAPSTAGICRRRCATRRRRSGSVSRRTPSHSIRTVAWPRKTIRSADMPARRFDYRAIGHVPERSNADDFSDRRARRPTTCAPLAQGVRVCGPGRGPAGVQGLLLVALTRAPAGRRNTLLRRCSARGARDGADQLGAVADASRAWCCR